MVGARSPPPAEATCHGADVEGGPFTAASPGTAHYCALTEAGEVICWGDSRFDPPPGRFTAISSGAVRTCAVTEDGEVVCWGDSTYRAWLLEAGVPW